MSAPVLARYIPCHKRHAVMTPSPRSPGEFRFEGPDYRASVPPAPGQEGRLMYACPLRGGPCGPALRIGNGFKPAGTRTWAWDGNLERPTISPSINCLARDPETGQVFGGCGWHGYIRAGEFIYPNGSPTLPLAYTEPS